MKPEIRVLGIDDSPFSKSEIGKKIIVFGVLYRGGSFLDGILSTTVRVDGMDATNQLIKMVLSCKFRPQIQAIFLDGIALAGFNVIDILRLYAKTNIPVIVVVRNNPNFVKIKAAVMHVAEGEKRYRIMRKAGCVEKVEIKKGKFIYIQFAGTTLENAKELLRITCTHSLIPEPIRIAHLIGQGIYFGQSKGKA